MPRPSITSQADIKRVCVALAKAGMGVARVELRPDGTIAIIPAPSLEMTAPLEPAPIVL